MSETPEAPKPTKKPLSTRPKFIASSIAAIIFLILILQNSESIAIDVFFWKATAPAALLYLIFAIIGFMVGWLVRKPKKHAAKD